MVAKKKNRMLIWELLIGAILAGVALIWETKHIAAKSNKKISKKKK